MEQKQLEVIEHINYQLKTSIFNQFESYEHTEYINGQEVVSEINREKHLELIMKWVVQELEKNFNIDEENINELGN
ncbi:MULTISPECIES: type II toxin-antitoxin system antitoxin, TscA family [Staphylococcus]|uniref:TscA family type II toxin-antitoxin system antitoxin n=1 Tax=Staphylococcus TaxID=1279 RepID=UPI0008A42976|nr:pathogenicity island protein [Staphylococcus sp. HMSC065D05]MCG2023309.1 pathogenicity island protein [Staphylococcus epidermidis]MCG2212856.1 pathogenicity island protein [Staphylococcus epidermidis]OFR28933.1 pathogenicity island protein [Staphylococcus sp. HMSC065D05]